MPYVHSLPTTVSFTGKGLLGYSFGPLKQDLDVYFIEVEKGHDVFMISKKITRTYYVLKGSGYFTIDNQRYDVRPGELVEVPPRVEYCYSGKMTLLAFARPGWFGGNDKFTKWNADVVGREAIWTDDQVSWRSRLIKARVFGKSPIGAYLRLNEKIWNALPASIVKTSSVRAYGHLLHSLARTQGLRSQAFSTFFLRNRPELELITSLLKAKARGETLKVAVLGCSTGAEAYSVAWTIKSARPDLAVSLQAVDISRQAVEFGKNGVYSLANPQLSSTTIVERVTKNEMSALFDQDGERITVKDWIKQGISWHVGDAGDPSLINALGSQDMVIANNFLCHMEPVEAERCLRNIARLVTPNGYLFVSGIDIDVRTKVASDSKWKPVEEQLEQIHEGDPCMRGFWPFYYAGLEPIDKRRSDWKTRYAATFQIMPAKSAVRTSHAQSELCEASTAV
jgi:chemotaxis methyl-accepting protein methylase